MCRTSRVLQKDALVSAVDDILDRYIRPREIEAGTKSSRTVRGDVQTPRRGYDRPDATPSYGHIVQFTIVEDQITGSQHSRRMEAAQLCRQAVVMQLQNGTHDETRSER